MVKQLTFAAFIISIGLIWLTGGWQAAAAFKDSDRLSNTILPADVQAISNPETTGPIFLAELQRIEAQAPSTATLTATTTGTQSPSSEDATLAKTEEASSSFFESVGPLKLIAAILLILAIVGVALAVIFMAAHKYSESLNREMPQPVYTQEKRLLKVIADSVKEIMHNQERDIQVGIVEFERTANAGVNLKLNTDTAFVEDSGKKLYRQLQTWRIEADRWGRIKKMTQDGVPRYILIEQPPAQVASKSDEGKKTENGKVELLLPAGTLPFGGEQSNSWSSTTVAVLSTRKHWMD